MIAQRVSTLLSLQTKPERRRQHKRRGLQEEQIRFVLEWPLTSNKIMSSFVLLSPHDIITAGDVFIGQFSINSSNPVIEAKYTIFLSKDPCVSLIQIRVGQIYSSWSLTKEISWCTSQLSSMLSPMALWDSWH